MKIIEDIIAKITPADKSIEAWAQKKLDSLTKPRQSLGKLEEFAKRIAGITGTLELSLKNKTIFVMAGDHGVAEEGVSLFPKEVTAQMVYNFLRGGAGINVLANHIGAKVVIVDMGVSADLESQSKLIIKKINYGTKNMTKRSAMAEGEAIRSIEAGIEVFEDEFKKGVDIVGTGDMGIGNTTPSSAITAVITGKTAEEVTGIGTGIDDKVLVHKIEVINKAVEINKPNPKDALDVLAKVGGFEIGGLTGVILGAAAKKIPVVIDGFISGAAALIAYCLEPKVKDYLIAAHCSAEKGHKVILDFIGLEPILDLNLKLGEGTGACLGINIVEAGARILTEMATFKNAGVSEEK